MTTCKKPKSQENLTPQPPHQGSGSLRGKGGQEGNEGQDWSFDQKALPVPSPLRGGLGRGSSSLLTPHTRRGLGRGYLYLLQKSITTKSSGFTIIECLLAIILVGIMMTAIAPVIVLSVATRVQARRVEQASLAARTYIDGIQTGTIPAPANLVPLPAPPLPGTFSPTDKSSFAAAAPPPAGTTLASCSGDPNDPNSPYCTNNATLSLYCVDNGGGCVGANTKDFVVQAFRSAAVPPVGVPPALAPTDDGSQGYLLGVRVYRADLFDGSSTLSTTKKRQENNLTSKVGTNTGGTGRVLGGSNGPMIELTTEVRPNVVPLNSTLAAPVPGVPTPTSPAPGSAMKNLCARLGCG